MLSAKHHLLFWVISISSVPLALLRQRLRAYLPSILADPVLDHVVHGLTFYALWNKRTPLWIYLACVGTLCVAADEALGEMGFTGTLPGKDEYDENGIRSLVAHGLASFVVLGTLEPIRQNRPDIEACGMGMFSEYPMLRGRRRNAISAATMGLLGLAALTGLLELVLYQVLGRWVDLPGFWFPEDLTLLEMFVHAWLLSPFLDVVETTIYAVSRIVWPVWFQGRERAIRNQP